ncbi:glucan endo-1,3-beta-glucosidase 11-like [Selaginella moellendorffii]|uniref:glucan endo-1,3-beta-glucosidase 11-like n=1 Tax=Selaginella moellendorffii TaxID=88036 RepID=UPI000D1C61C6|nr:glucan endo-1,3-beta-glucosidase 11-like [Selaginella moellendorffii]|eukprot:XP_024538131.1 glucan endo-1,3-beta-glucosidase 11-like [Selaginella moellendorffii]
MLAKWRTVGGPGASYMFEHFPSLRARKMAAPREWILALVLLIIVNLSLKASSTSSIGVNYGRMSDNLPSPAQAAQLLIQHGITKVKLYDADPSVISAFASTGIQIAVSMYNEVIWQLASSQEQADSWLASAILPHLAANASIEMILLGNEVLTRADPALAPQLVPAMRNLHKTLVTRGLDSRIKLTTSHAMDVLDFSRSFPPSAGIFRPGMEETMKPLLDFLAETSSPFLIDAYPYFAYRDDKGEHIDLEFALLDPNSSGTTDWITGLHYPTMLDAQVDTIYAAMGRLGYGNGEVRVIVGETGWPSAGDERNFGAGMENARKFVQNLVRRQQQGLGTPLHPQVSIESYIFALFNEDLKQGSTAERNFGLFYPNMTQVYSVEFSLNMFK